MAEMIHVTVRLDKEIKEQAEKMFNDFGMSLSTHSIYRKRKVKNFIEIIESLC